MPAEYILDRSRNMVFTKACGVLTDDDVFSHQDMLRCDPDFTEDYDQLLVLDVTEMKLTCDGVHVMAKRNPFGEGSRRAFVAPSPITFSLSRMFQILTDEHKDDLIVCKDLTEALAYLEFTQDQLPDEWGNYLEAMKTPAAPSSET